MALDGVSQGAHTQFVQPISGYFRALARLIRTVTLYNSVECRWPVGTRNVNGVASRPTGLNDLSRWFLSCEHMFVLIQLGPKALTWLQAAERQHGLCWYVWQCSLSVFGIYSKMHPTTRANRNFLARMTGGDQLCGPDKGKERLNWARSAECVCQLNAAHGPLDEPTHKRQLAHSQSHTRMHPSRDWIQWLVLFKNSLPLSESLSSRPPSTIISRQFAAIVDKQQVSPTHAAPNSRETSVTNPTSFSRS